MLWQLPYAMHILRRGNKSMRYFILIFIFFVSVCLAVTESVSSSVSLEGVQDQQTIQHGQALTLSVSGGKPVAKDAQLAVLFDGKLFSTENGRLTLVDLDRGAHQVQAVFLDVKGQKIAASKIKTFYVYQASILGKNN